MVWKIYGIICVIRIPTLISDTIPKLDMLLPWVAGPCLPCLSLLNEVILAYRQHSTSIFLQAPACTPISGQANRQRLRLLFKLGRTAGLNTAGGVTAAWAVGRSTGVSLAKLKAAVAFCFCWSRFRKFFSVETECRPCMSQHVQISEL